MSTCHQCRAPLPENAPLGVCPACLLEGGARKGEVREEVDLGFLEESARPDALGCFDDYEVREVLGQGASGIVLKAEDRSLRRTVAIKVLYPVLATGAVSRERFLREARAAAAVSHPHVVTIHAVGEWKGLPYLVMECIEGRTLAERIDAEGALDLREILRIGRQMAAGLAAAHAQGLVHRDIKPGNVLLENSVERVKLTDFGLARSREESGLTLTGFVSGTPEYMSPEQVEGGAVDARSDLYSLGAVVYAMATGLSPFRGGSALAVLRQVAESAPMPPGKAGSEVPSWLEKQILKLMAKAPSARPQSAKEVEDWFGSKLAALQRGGVSASDARKWRRRIATAAAVAVVIGLGWTFRPGARTASDADRKEDPDGRIVVVPRPPTNPGAALTPAGEAERERFERYVRVAQSETVLQRVGAAPDIDELLVPESLVYHLGWYRREVTDPARAQKALDLPAFARKLGVERPEQAVYVVFITGDGAGRRSPEDLVKSQLDQIERGVIPPQGVWVGALVVAEALAMLPEDHREKGRDFWAVVPPAQRAGR